MIVGDAPPGERVPVGPEGDTLPRAFEATYTHTAEPLTLHLQCRFPGDRIVVDEVCVLAKGDRTITPRDMSAVELERAVRLAAATFAQPGEGHGAAHFDERPGRRPTADEIRHVAAVYCFHHAAWGDPRKAVMEIWDIPRSTANRWIRKAQEAYPGHMPRLDDRGVTGGES